MIGIPYSYSRCDNTSCGKEFPTSQAMWIAKTYTVCCEPCKIQFLADNAPIVESHLKILGLDIPETREALLKLAVMVL